MQFEIEMVLVTFMRLGFTLPILGKLHAPKIACVEFSVGQSSSNERYIHERMKCPGYQPGRLINLRRLVSVSADLRDYHCTLCTPLFGAKLTNTNTIQLYAACAMFNYIYSISAITTANAAIVDPAIPRWAAPLEGAVACELEVAEVEVGGVATAVALAIT